MGFFKLRCVALFMLLAVNIYLCLRLAPTIYDMTHFQAEDLVQKVAEDYKDNRLAENSIPHAKQDAKNAPKLGERIANKNKNSPVENMEERNSVDDKTGREYGRDVQPLKGEHFGNEIPRVVYNKEVNNRPDATFDVNPKLPDIYKGHFDYILNPQHICNGHTLLLMVVTSSVSHFALRDAIRKTWGSVSDRPQLGVRLVFILGLPSDEDRPLQDDILEEYTIHRDIIQQSFIDHYANLTIKSIGYLKWVHENCLQTRFLLKCNDDVFLNVPNLLQQLLQLLHSQKQGLLLGNVIEGAKPMTDRISKWYTPDSVYTGRTYPKYISGVAYVISGDLLPKLYRSALTMKLFWLEDVYITGMVAKEVGAVLIHNSRFEYKKHVDNPCWYKMSITGHELTADDLYKIWTDIHRQDLDCLTEKLHFGT